MNKRTLVCIAYTFRAPGRGNLKMARVSSDGSWATFCSSITEPDWSEKRCWQEVQNLLTSWSGMKIIPHVEADELWCGTEEESAKHAAALAETDPDTLWKLSRRFRETPEEVAERLRWFDERLRAALEASVEKDSRPWSESDEPWSDDVEPWSANDEPWSPID